MENEICTVEASLRIAMLRSDIIALDKLLSPDLVFINHHGQIMSKQDDITAHQSGKLKIHAIEIVDQQIRVYDRTAIVIARTNIVGIFDKAESNCLFQFTRVWNKNIDHNWQVVSAHSCFVL